MGICLRAVRDCLKASGKHAGAHHLGLLNFGQICQAAHDFMLRHSHLQHLTCGACAEICEACAQSCEELGHSDCP